MILVYKVAMHLLVVSQKTLEPNVTFMCVLYELIFYFMENLLTMDATQIRYPKIWSNVGKILLFS